jgi:hypothetical protein
MSACVRTLAGFTFLVSLVMLLLSLAGGVGVWVVKEPVRAKATHAFERVEGALDVADQSLDHVKASLARAAERLDGVREEQRKLAANPPKLNTMRRFLTQTIQQRVAPELGDANEKLHTVAEAAVVVNSVLEDLGTFPLLSVTGLDVDQLRDLNGSLSQVATSAWNLSRLLGEPPPPSDPDAAAMQLSRVERTLKTIQGLVAKYEPQLREVRQRTEELKAKTLPWITPAAIIISVVCFWVALSQVSLMVHACSWWRRAGKGNSPATPT